MFHDRVLTQGRRTNEIRLCVLFSTSGPSRKSEGVAIPKKTDTDACGQIQRKSKTMRPKAFERDAGTKAEWHE
jgi:hypothetical protein